jgi:hypothetical protein
VWVNHNNEPVPDGRTHTAAKAAHSAREVREAISEGHTAINYKTPDAAAGVQTARSIGYYECNQPLEIIVDEAQNVMPDGCEPDNVLRRCLDQDRDKGIRAVLITQKPSNLEYDPFGNIKQWAWVGMPAGMHDGFFHAHSWLPENQLPQERFRYVVMDKRGEINYRGQTKEKYA